MASDWTSVRIDDIEAIVGWQLPPRASGARGDLVQLRPQGLHRAGHAGPDRARMMRRGDEWLEVSDLGRFILFGLSCIGLPFAFAGLAALMNGRYELGAVLIAVSAISWPVFLSLRSTFR